MAQVGLREWFMALKRAPETHRHPGQMQLPRHHQGVAAVVSWAHQHQGRRRRSGQQPAGNRQGCLLH